MSAQQKWLGFAIFLFFKACQREIIKYSCYWSPCKTSTMNSLDSPVSFSMTKGWPQKVPGASCYFSLKYTVYSAREWRYHCSTRCSTESVLQTDSTTKVCLYCNGSGPPWQGWKVKDKNAAIFIPPSTLHLLFLRCHHSCSFETSFTKPECHHHIHVFFCLVSFP